MDSRTDQIIGLVSQSQPPATYKGADLSVLPPEYEPFGVVVNEAFATRNPAIPRPRAALPKISYGTTRSGFTYACGNMAALHLRQLVAEPDLTDRSRTGARQRISTWGLSENAEAFAQGLLNTTGAET